MTTTGSVEGVVSTQAGTIRLPGAVVTLTDSDGVPVAQQVADADGAYRIAPAPRGVFRISGALEGFRLVEVSVTIAAGQTTHVDLDLPIADISERVEVVAPATTVTPTAETIAPGSALESRELEQYTPGGGFQAALRLLASAIEVPGGVSIKGGRSNQSSVQLGVGTLIDPSTGLVPLTLPADAVESVAVLPNPYSVEFGRFSSGVVIVDTRRAGDSWNVRLNDFDPNFRTSRDNNAKIIGLQEFAPRIEFGGPIVPQRVFLEQTAQYRYLTTDVPSRPERELKKDRWFSTFTRVDGTLAPRHSVVGTGGLFRRRADEATLGTFVPPEATVNLEEHISHATGTERSVWTDSLISESTFRIQEDTTRDDPQGTAPMRLLPDTTLGNFYNAQSRITTIYQWVDSATLSRNGPGGLHLIKTGIDVLHSRYAGTSASRPVLVERADGTLTRRLDFGPPTRQRVKSTDVALFAQDRVQPASRWYAEFGARLDRDGILNEWNLTPRAGAALLLTANGNAVLRGGYGLFFERTPSAAGAFDQIEETIDTRYAADGVTPTSLPVLIVHTRAPDLETPRSATWNLAYDHRLTAEWSFHAGVLDRRSSHELILNPQLFGPSQTLLLTSTGRSEYREGEVGVHFKQMPGLDVEATYVRSYSRADLNAFTAFFGNVRWPIIPPNSYAATAADVPHRLLVRGRYQTRRWLLLTITDWRSGFPYSIVNETLDYVGPRNIYRFPAGVRVEAGVERRLNIFRWRPWIGFRVNNALRSFLPTDVQANLASPYFGSFYNSEYRKIRLIVRFER